MEGNYYIKVSGFQVVAFKVVANYSNPTYLHAGRNIFCFGIE